MNNTVVNRNYTVKGWIFSLFHAVRIEISMLLWLLSILHTFVDLWFLENELQVNFNFTHICFSCQLKNSILFLYP